ncbi:hydroxymethylglutaryl-CoA lyase [Mesorhizobium sp. J18]|uniref:hydroxymethylglutaryl-CoA lyase n=1 Tax=Mesorhizobium sp. J18 TaxID=935263 RepID=UPI001198DC97|nr:hydroxymethylglutaryl-CoA lyase [Mesorhizobium sp. J18]TWG96386.1 hydroxymethylglutaryl-CoA lyase [Mesorhizobium sp. J18]
MSARVEIREVGLRDGLQQSGTILPTERKKEWILRAAAMGIREMEVTSFIPPHVLPQFFDAEDVATFGRDVPGLLASALVVNLKGAQRAFATGIRKVNYVVSASEAHSAANARRTTDQALDEFDRIVEERERSGLSGSVTLGCGVATAFGCTIQGAVDPSRVDEIVARLAKAGADEIMLADTVGYANPQQVARLFEAALKTVDGVAMAAHFHDTRGLGLANVMSALNCGVRRFDASTGGLGGCPFAPGATGNIDTEGFVYLLESSGFDTGIDLDALLALRKDLAGWLPTDKLDTPLAKAGLPLTFATRNATNLTN